MIIVFSFCLLRHSSVCPLPTQVFSSTSTTLPIRVGLSLRAYRHLLNALSKKWPAVVFPPCLYLSVRNSWMLFLVAWPWEWGLHRGYNLPLKGKRNKRVEILWCKSDTCSLSCLISCSIGRFLRGQETLPKATLPRKLTSAGGFSPNQHLPSQCVLFH